MKPMVLISGIATTVVLATTANAQQSRTASEMIDMFEKLSGKQPGLRKAHATGICAQGTFKPNKTLSDLSSSELFKQASVPASIRFSMGSGNPSADERAPGARGMAIQLKLPNGAIHNIVGNSTPVFAAKDPDVFFGLLETLLPNEEGKVDFAKVGQYIAQHPSTQPLAQWQRTTPAPYSYANSEFYGLHTFYFENEKKELTKFRWHTTPDSGIRLLTEDELSTSPTKFLNQRLIEQSKNNTISYTINAAIGLEGDTTIDPSKAWPADREIRELGKLTLTSVGGEACTPTNFDPNVVTVGFKTSNDPVLRMRSPAYAVSFGKRLSGQ